MAMFPGKAGEHGYKKSTGREINVGDALEKPAAVKGFFSGLYLLHGVYGDRNIGDNLAKIWRLQRFFGARLVLFWLCGVGI